MKIINDKYIRETYIDYDERVKYFLSRVYIDCMKANKQMNNYFYCCLDLLANQLKLYYLGLDAIEANKNISSTDDYKRVSKNPAIAVMNHAHQQILDILEKLGLSPFASAKIKRLNKDDSDESAEALLDNLIN